MRTMRRSGLTLIELILLIAVFVYLLALLSPAVLRLRGLSSGHTCKDNLSRIGMAAHNYHNDYGWLPPASIGPYHGGNGELDGPFNWNGAHVGCLALLLPYLEQEDLYKQCFYYNWKNSDLPSPATYETAKGEITFKDGNPRWDVAPVGPKGFENRDRARARIKTFHCPADIGLYGDPRKGFAVTIHAYHDTMPIGYWPNKNDVHPLALMQEWGRTNYMACVGAIGRGGREPVMPYAAFEGMTTSRSKKTLTHVTNADGTSNTLMYGEATHGPIVANPGQPEGKRGVGVRDFAFTWMGCGEMATAWGLPPNGGQWYTFGSAHPKTVNFCFGDRSVRGIRRAGIDGSFFTPFWWMYMQLSGYKDGFNQNTAVIVD